MKFLVNAIDFDHPFMSPGNPNPMVVEARSRGAARMQVVLRALNAGWYSGGVREALPRFTVRALPKGES